MDQVSFLAKLLQLPGIQNTVHPSQRRHAGSAIISKRKLVALVDYVAVDNMIK